MIPRNCSRSEVLDRRLNRGGVAPLMAVYLMTVLLGTRMTAEAQELPRFRIETKQDFLDAVGVFDNIDRSFPRAALVALEGRRVFPWVLDVVADSTLPFLKRQAAMRVLYYSRDSLALPMLLGLVGGDNWRERAHAKEVLRVFPYEPACRYWRHLMQSPQATDGDIDDALIGLRHCGTRDDADLIRDFRDRTQRAVHRRLADLALTAVQTAEVDRYTRDGTFGGPPEPGGRYRPSAEAARKIQAIVCGGPCSRNLVLDPKAELNERSPRR